MPEFDDDNKTIFSSDLDSTEKAAVATGEARGKKEYMKDNPKCGLVGVSDQFRENYDNIDWSKK